MTKLVWDKTGRWVPKDKWVNGRKVTAEAVAAPVAEPEKPKRTRRTKVEMEALRAAEAAAKAALDAAEHDDAVVTEAEIDA